MGIIPDRKPDLGNQIALMSVMARGLGCKIEYTAERKISFNTDMVIFLHPDVTLDNAYSLAHEIGHLIQFIEGRLNYGLWKNNKPYRICAEMEAWAHAYEILSKFEVSLDKWSDYVQKKLMTYFKTNRIQG
jgi:hypothetical protein